MLPRAPRATIALRTIPPALLCLTQLACADRAAVAELKEKVAALEQRNQALEAKVKLLEQRAGVQQGNAAGALSPLAGLLGQVFRGGGTPAPRPSRAQPMDPDLQRRLDRMMVDAMDKLAHSDDAKQAVKALLKMMAGGFDAQRAAQAPLSSPTRAPTGCRALERAVTAAITLARLCTTDADCTVERFGTCGLKGMHCYAAVFNDRHKTQVLGAMQDYLDGCSERQRCRCRTPAAAVCRAGRCAPRP